MISDTMLQRSLAQVSANLASRARASSAVRWILAILVTQLVACASIPETKLAETSTKAQALFDATAVAHGADAFKDLTDISVAYDGEWFDLIQKIQGVLVDPEYRKQSEERLLLKDGLTGQIHTGPKGEKFVSRFRRDADGEAKRDVTVIYDNAHPSSDVDVLHAAALVVDAYRLFLLAPLHFLDQTTQMELLTTVKLDGRLMDRLRIRTEPGLGASDRDDYVLYIDREDRLVRRIRFTIEGLASTRGAVVETDLSEYVERGGVKFPTRFFERVRKPIPRLSAHAWRMTGLDLDRGMTAEDLADGQFSGAAAKPAEPLPASSPERQAENEANR